MPRMPKIRMCVDRNLTPQQQAKAAIAAIEENPENAPPMGVAPSGAMSMALITGKKWRPGKTLTVAFLDGPKAKHNMIRKVAPQWSDYANIRFRFVTGRAADIRISFVQPGAWSYIGTDALGIPRAQCTMNFGFIDEATILHEFGHALGCIHEHQHPETGIPWDKEKVYAYFAGPPNYWSKAQIDFNLFQKYDRKITQFSEYDRHSIMHYPVDRNLTDGVFEVGWNGALSVQDKQFISTAYPGRLAMGVCPDTLLPTCGSYRITDQHGKKVIIFGE